MELAAPGRQDLIRDQEAWTSQRKHRARIVAQNVAAERWKEAIEQLRKWDIELNTSVYVSLLRHCGETGCLERGKVVHAHLTRLGYDVETFLGNHLVHMYGKCGSTRDASRVFHRIGKQNVYSWNIVIAAYAANGEVLKARAMLDKMPKKSVVAWNTMVTAYSETGDVHEAKEVFDTMTERDDVSWSALFAAYAKNGLPRQALMVARLMDLEGVKPNVAALIGCLEACEEVGSLSLGRQIHWKIDQCACGTDTNVRNALITMYARFGSLEDAKKIFEGIAKPTVVSETSMVAAYSLFGHIEEARKLFDKMLYRNIVSWNAMLTGYAQNGRGVEALLLFRKMDLEGLKVNDVTFVSAVDACASSMLVSDGKAICSRALSCGRHCNIFVANALISFYGKCGLLQEARCIFDNIKHPDEVSWNSIVAACVHSGNNDQALYYFHSMAVESVVASDMTFASVLPACSQAGLVDEARDYFLSMVQDYCISPSFTHYTCMVDALGRAGRLRAAESLIEGMPFEPDTFIWRTFLGACKLHGNEVKAKQVAAYASNQIGEDDSAPFSLISSVIACSKATDDDAEGRSKTAFQAV